MVRVAYPRITRNFFGVKQEVSSLLSLFGPFGKKIGPIWLPIRPIIVRILDLGRGENWVNLLWPVVERNGNFLILRQREDSILTTAG